MPDTKISALTASTAAAPMADELAVNAAGTSKKLTMALARAIPYATGSFTIPTEAGMVMVGELTLTGTQEAAVQGTGELRIL